MREQWAGRDRDDDDSGLPVAKYVEQLGERISDALKAAGVNMEQTQHRNKTNFDRQSTVRNLEPGDDVLVLMPSHSSKFLARWGGPHKVVQKHPDNNYVVDINGRNAILHINALRRYNTDFPDSKEGTDEIHLDQDVSNHAPVDSDQLVPTAVIINADPLPSDSAYDGFNDLTPAAVCLAEVRMGEQLTDRPRATDGPGKKVQR